MGLAADAAAADVPLEFDDDELLIRNSERSLDISKKQLLLQQVQLLLAEKRTALATLRTGLAVMAAPLSVVSFLVVASRLYDVLDSLWLLAPLLSLCVVLVAIGSYLIMRAIVRIHQFDDMIRDIKARDEELQSLIVVD